MSEVCCVWRSAVCTGHHLLQFPTWGSILLLLLPLPPLPLLHLGLQSRTLENSASCGTCRWFSFPKFSVTEWLVSGIQRRSGDLFQSNRSTWSLPLHGLSGSLRVPSHGPSWRGGSILPPGNFGLKDFLWHFSGKWINLNVKIFGLVRHLRTSGSLTLELEIC